MRIYKLSGRNLSVANVGSTNSSDDKSRIDRTVTWLASNDPLYSQDMTFNSDNINLNRGRDFLKESKQYDIVILHHIYNGTDSSDKGSGIYNNSPEHNRETWIKRLSSTGADYIFVYGYYTEVGGWWIGDIPGYNYMMGLDGYESIYRNEKLSPLEIEEKKPIEGDKIDVSWLNPSNTDPHSP